MLHISRFKRLLTKPRRTLHSQLILNISNLAYTDRTLKMAAKTKIEVSKLMHQHLCRPSCRIFSLLTITQLRDPSLLRNKCYVNGEWVGAKSGKVFSVESMFLYGQFS